MSFEKIIEFTLKWEGFLSDDKDDPGGLTKYGISQKHHPALNIPELTLDEAKELYRKEYWEPIESGYDDLDMVGHVSAEGAMRFR